MINRIVQTWACHSCKTETQYENERVFEVVYCGKCGIKETLENSTKI